MKTAFLFLTLSLALLSCRAADPTLALQSVHTLLSSGNWTQLAPPAVATATCQPHHRFCRRFLEPKEIILQSGYNSVNFPMVEAGAPASDNLRMQVYMSGVSGVDRIYAHTGPRSTGKRNLQHALWACPVVPELELRLDPHGGDKEILENVLLEIIFYFEACDLDVVGGEHPADHLLLGVENMFTKQMVLSPVTAFSSRINTNVANEGQLALHVNLTQITPGHNRYLLVRGNLERILPVFNAEQGNSDQYTYSAVATYNYPLMVGILSMVFITLVIVAALVFRTDRKNADNATTANLQIAQNAELVKAVQILSDDLKTLKGNMNTHASAMQAFNGIVGRTQRAQLTHYGNN